MLFLVKISVKFSFFAVKKKTSKGRVSLTECRLRSFPGPWVDDGKDDNDAAAADDDHHDGDDGDHDDDDYKGAKGGEVSPTDCVLTPAHEVE